jgi:signal transduction histidine kinase/ligand-binding sensor domain-containing protein
MQGYWRALHFRGAALIFLISPAFSQIAIDIWTADDGLPQNITRAVCQTPDGYLWIATFDGLVRFDGVRFTTFSRSNTRGLNGNRFGTMFCTTSGDIWAGTEGTGLTRYRQGRFTTFTTRDGLLSNTVDAVSGDDHGRLWALAKGHLHEWQESRQRFVPLEREEDRYTYWVSADGRGGFWRIDEKGLNLFDRGQRSIYLLPAGWPRNPFVMIGRDVNGSLWLSTSNGDVAELAGSRWNWVLRNGSAALASRAQSAFISEYRDSHGRVWPTETEWIRKAGLVSYLKLPPGNRPERIPFTSLFEDREGSIWLCTDGQGLFRVRTEAIKAFSQEQGLPDRNVYPIFQSRDGSIWIGTWSGGLCRYKNSQFTTYPVADHLGPHRINSIFEDRSGALWVAERAALYRLTNRSFKPVPWKAGTLSGEPAIRVIHQDPHGTMWFGTGEGLVGFDGHHWQTFTRKDGLATDDTRAIINGRDDTLWVAGYGGLSSLRNGNLRSWTERDGLASNMIRALYEDADGVLWIGTYDGGLSRFRNGRFTSYTVREGLANNGAFQILEDSSPNLWMTCNRGIYRVSKRDLNDFAAGRISRIVSVAYGKHDGMRNAECNGGLMPAGIKAQDGTLWVPTQDGVVVIDPEKLIPAPKPPPVNIESCMIDRVAVELQSTIRVSPVSENIEIDYTAPSLINSERIRFRYRLEGLDTGWVEADTRRTAYYSHLPAGNYTFKVTAAHSDGAWNPEGASLALIVLPPFYRTWWFTLSAWMIGTSAVGLIIRYRFRQLERARASQQAFSRQLIAYQEGERKRLAAELHDSLGQRLIVIKNLAVLFLKSVNGNQGERRKIDEISDECSRAIDEVREISYNLRPHQLDRLGLTKAVLALVRTAAKATPAKIIAEVDDIDTFFPKEAEISFYRIVQECLTNVVKHSDATEVHLSVRCEEAAISLAVRDNGKGFTPGMPVTDPSNGGFGLVGIRERAQLLGGRTRIHTASGLGTTVSIHFAARESRNGT